MEKDGLEKRLLAHRKISARGCWEWTLGKNGYGYGYTAWEGKIRSVHRWALFLWRNFSLKSPLCVLHSCDNPPCFNPSHLFLGTRSQNTYDREKKGRGAKGEKVGTSRLNSAKVFQIREYRARGNWNVSQLARFFDVNRATIWAILTGKSWRHI